MYRLAGFACTRTHTQPLSCGYLLRCISISFPWESAYAGHSHAVKVFLLSCCCYLTVVVVILKLLLLL